MARLDRPWAQLTTYYQALSRPWKQLPTSNTTTRETLSYYKFRHKNSLVKAFIHQTICNPESLEGSKLKQV